MKPRMNAKERELILKEEVYAVVGCAIEALKVGGHGLHERIYENCLCVEVSTARLRIYATGTASSDV